MGWLILLMLCMWFMFMVHPSETSRTEDIRYRPGDYYHSFPPYSLLTASVTLTDDGEMSMNLFVPKSKLHDSFYTVVVINDKTLSLRRGNYADGMTSILWQHFK